MDNSPIQRLKAATTDQERISCALEIANHHPPYPASLVEYANRYLARIKPKEQLPVKPKKQSSEQCQRDAAAIKSSIYFDSEWYMQKSIMRAPNTEKTNRDELIIHYCEVGWLAGLDPGPTFSTNFYLEQYPDVAKAKINPLYHYIIQGKREGRMACPLPSNEKDPYQLNIDIQYVRESTKSTLHFKNQNYKSVAFYLPQYHPIPENDAWWGEGFTEWTNVKPAKPMFQGHYQPHEPGELGHYTIEDNKILRRQVNIAKNYGVDAFCFYFYWFNGKTLLEKPLAIFLNDKSLDHGFCLCWANENWTRRWDGKENDILLAQNYSHEDDHQFIQYIAKYLKDPRYLRIEGKPVLLIYRPSLLPDCKATTKIWREWCINHGIGDLHLVYTQSFECEHPSTYGCDAGTEFAPNIPIGHQGATPHLVTNTATSLNPDFNGKIFDWTAYVDRSEHLPHPGYPIYRCINPGWDNTARKKNNATIFINSSPRGFQQWALNAIKDTTFAHNDKGLLFINAWNEWAEGAHLEPDQRYGYGYLEALRMARTRHNYINQCRAEKENSIPKPAEIAIVIHAFYPEILNEIIEYCKRIPLLERVWFVVTTPPEKSQACRDVISSHNIIGNAIVFETENHGRDILPFCKVYEFLFRIGIKVFCKLHTKKSTHRDDGDTWRHELYSGLLDPMKAQSIITALHTNSGIGIVLPGNHILKMTEFFGANCDTVCALTARLGMPIYKIRTLPLVAGSMFWARIEALIPLHMLYDENTFEAEYGQVDGTFAHAFERMFSISCACLELEVANSDLERYNPDTSKGTYAFSNRG